MIILKNSLVTRIAIGKIIGLVIGVIGFAILSAPAIETSASLRWGVLFWYVNLGAIIGLLGIFTWHPLLRMPIAWWLRAPLVGAWMNLVLAMFVHERFTQNMSLLFGEDSMFVSPLWLVLIGAATAMLIDFVATRFAGDGKDLTDMTRTVGENKF